MNLRVPLACRIILQLFFFCFYFDTSSHLPRHNAPVRLDGFVLAIAIAIAVTMLIFIYLFDIPPLLLFLIRSKVLPIRRGVVWRPGR
ncbi:hypothetical protein BDV95DRAFT_378052 [Massariosphaeria phaeospora]|uniref:Uncharacterized protein n=1 Tax=Massariosphaeria phaeospora TaxID=100035 RepID=A0A7C8I8F2_9PLEO|nr:hypothetical protein BDV95DRAFT_378052 [Massariosphaeria phaeospora]